MKKNYRVGMSADNGEEIMEIGVFNTKKSAKGHVSILAAAFESVGFEVIGIRGDTYLLKRGTNNSDGIWLCIRKGNWI